MTVVSDADIKKPHWQHVRKLSQLHCDVSVIGAPLDLCQHKHAQDILNKNKKGSL